MTKLPHDSTHEQAMKWMNAEAEKCDTIERVSERLEQELILSQIMDNHSNLEHFPNIVQAHKDLIKVLIAKREKLERRQSFTVVQGGKD